MLRRGYVPRGKMNAPSTRESRQFPLCVRFALILLPFQLIAWHLFVIRLLSSLRKSVFDPSIVSLKLLNA